MLVAAADGEEGTSKEALVSKRELEAVVNGLLVGIDRTLVVLFEQLKVTISDIRVDQQVAEHFSPLVLNFSGDIKLVDEVFTDLYGGHQIFKGVFN